MDLGEYERKKNEKVTSIIRLISELDHWLYELIHTENLEFTEVFMTEIYACNYEAMATDIKFLSH